VTGPRRRVQALGLRVLSGLVLAPIAIAAAWLGGWFLTGLLGVIVLAATVEFLLMARRAGIPILVVPGMTAALALVVLAAQHDTRGSGVLFVVIMTWTFAESLRAPVEKRLMGLAVTWFGVAYVAGLGVHLLWLRAMPRGVELLLFTLLATWAADTFAFLVGVRWGRRLLAPHISPGKTVEGALGGLVGAATVAALTASVLHPQLLTLGQAVVVGAMIGVAAPLGDLIESMLKRNLGAKDSSRLIPGHGGVLDRIDGLLVAGPVAYIMFRLLLP
jgi:phosphatidate cytidylyltransferase